MGSCEKYLGNIILSEQASSVSEAPVYIRSVQCGAALLLWPGCRIYIAFDGKSVRLSWG